MGAILEIEINQDDGDLDRSIESAMDSAEFQTPDGKTLSKVTFVGIEITSTPDGERNYRYKYEATYI